MGQGLSGSWAVVAFPTVCFEAVRTPLTAPSRALYCLERSDGGFADAAGGGGLIEFADGGIGGCAEVDELV